MKRLLLLSLLIFACNNQPNIENQEDGPKIKSIYEAEYDLSKEDSPTNRILNKATSSLYNFDGKIVEQYSLEYNAVNKIKTFTYDQNNNLNEEVLYYYDDNDYNDDFTEGFTTFYYYDENNNLIEKNWLQYGEPGQRFTYSYDDNNNLLETKSTSKSFRNGEGATKGDWIIEYNYENNILISQTGIEQNRITKTLYSYDEEGNLLNETYLLNGRFNEEKLYSYDNGNLVRELLNSNNDEKKKEFLYLYDQLGNKLSSIEDYLTLKITCDYYYDKYQNLVEKNCITEYPEDYRSDRKVNTYRYIEYYESN